MVLGLFFQFYPVCNFGQLDNLSIWDLALSRVKEVLNSLIKLNAGQRVRYKNVG